MQAIIGSRTVRLFLVFAGLFLLIRILVVVQITVQNESDIWTLHILTSSLLRTSRHRPDNISKTEAFDTSSGDSQGFFRRMNSAFGAFLVPAVSTINRRHQGSNESRLILDWTTFFSTKLSDMANESMSLCPVQCTFSNDHTQVGKADAVIFHIRDTKPKSLPTIRHSFQRYVFFLKESPIHTGPVIRRLSNNFFNWTMTYRRDSDILWDYDRFMPKNATDYPYEKSEYSWDYVVDAIKGKKKMVAQLVSNCHTSSKRENYVEELAESISVDVFGSCSGKKCSGDCTKMLTDDYLFYLSFENSVCLDYVTEKFWRMKTLIVPIVLRASDYAEIAPSGSYIAADQFKSPKHLAAYLNRLANNRTEYLTYFEWTKHFWYSSGSQRTFCDLCERLHDDTIPPKSYDNMVEWWTTKGNCKYDFAHKLLVSS